MDIRCQGVWGMSDMVIRQWWADRYISDDAMMLTSCSN